MHANDLGHPDRPVFEALSLLQELELKCKRALLGVTDAAAKDALAAEEVARTIDDGARHLSQRFVKEVLQEALRVELVVALVAELVVEQVAEPAVLLQHREGISWGWFPRSLTLICTIHRDSALFA